MCVWGSASKASLWMCEVGRFWLLGWCCGCDPKGRNNTLLNPFRIVAGTVLPSTTRVLRCMAKKKNCFLRSPSNDPSYYPFSNHTHTHINIFTLPKTPFPKHNKNNTNHITLTICVREIALVFWGPPPSKFSGLAKRSRRNR